MNEARSPRRLEFLDAVRGVAAFCVLLYHLLADATPALHAFTVRWFNLGDFGVYAFFLVSGFIIPVSMERHPTLLTFWRSRFLRLYPPFWFSLGAAVILGAFGAMTLDPTFLDHPLRNIVGNLTMMPYFLHIPQALGVYWTLAVELIFYGLCTALLLTRMLQRRVLVLCAAVVVDLLCMLACDTRHFHGAHFQSTFSGLLLTALLGSVVYQIFAGGRRPTPLFFLSPIVLGTVFLGIRLRYVLHPQATDGEYFHFYPQALSWAAAFVFFFTMYSLRQRHFAAPLLWLGRVSYSLYLIHGIVIGILESLHLRRPIFLALAILLSLFAAELCYRFIEKPFSTMASRTSSARTGVATKTAVLS